MWLKRLNHGMELVTQLRKGVRATGKKNNNLSILTFFIILTSIFCSTNNKTTSVGVSLTYKKSLKSNMFLHKSQHISLLLKLLALWLVFLLRERSLTKKSEF